MRRLSFLVYPAILIALAGCRSGPKALPPTMPLEPGFGACTTTIRSEGQQGTIRAVHDARSIQELVDLDGDGQLEEQRRTTLDSDGRVIEIERLSPDGTQVVSRETRAWDGRRLLRRQTDRLLADGTSGADGTPDEDVTLAWQDGQLQREAVDQLNADGLLGIDGQPEIVTTWVHENGVRVRGTQVDVRDDTVLRVDHLDWEAERLVRQRIDLGGDGEDDITITNTWRDGRVAVMRVVSAMQVAEVTYEYCR